MAPGLSDPAELGATHVKLTIDTELGILSVVDGDHGVDLDLYSTEGFAELSKVWTISSWAAKYSYGFTWLGRPIIQLPEDLVRSQELVWTTKPDVIIETGIAHGGSLIFWASLFESMRTNGRVIGVDIEIRPHNRVAIENHHLMDRITLIEADSVAESTLELVRTHIKFGDRVMVVLDSDHSRGHVLKELIAYAPLVSVGQFLVATDGVMRDLTDIETVPETWADDNPVRAVEDFLKTSSDFVLEQRFPQAFCESAVLPQLTYWPSSLLKRVK
jgi:cephalosporin hydroxylase